MPQVEEAREDLGMWEGGFSVSEPLRPDKGPYNGAGSCAGEVCCTGEDDGRKGRDCSQDVKESQLDVPRLNEVTSLRPPRGPQAYAL